MRMRAFRRNKAFFEEPTLQSMLDAKIGTFERFEKPKDSESVLFLFEV
jgi:hypothetical protein